MKTAKIIKIMCAVFAVFVILGTACTAHAIIIDNTGANIASGQIIVGSNLKFYNDNITTEQKYDSITQIRKFITDYDNDNDGLIMYDCNIKITDDYTAYKIRMKQEFTSLYVCRIQFGFLVTYDGNDGSIGHMGINYIDCTYDYDSRTFTSQNFNSQYRNIVIRSYDLNEAENIIAWANTFYILNINYDVPSDLDVLDNQDYQDLQNDYYNDFNNIDVLINISGLNAIYYIFAQILFESRIRYLLNIVMFFGMAVLVVKLLSRVSSSGVFNKRE